MILTPIIRKAIGFSIKTHEIYQKQKRKGKDIPYITHPLTAGLILARAGADDEVIAAGILHDTVEDSVPEKKVTREILAEEFGERVAELVMSVTEDENLSWEERKQRGLEDIQTLSYNSLLVKSADIISNVSEIIDDYKKCGETVWERFHKPKEITLGNIHRRNQAILERWPENPLAEDLRKLGDELAELSTSQE